ncbi:NfeD family protein [Hansschlegelia sp.]|uniref:NfeD family protein n=1 Tax=Hansschlegelia sp. TaxID=2041892 RepID=UPI002CE91022|nr:NfeD family protein [Hansschlegelia sp.]HVI27789.1 NfeD family protein [Hansschlegelia sp.]
MLPNVVVALGAWRWFVFGLLLLTAELIIPGSVLLWLGIAAILVGFVAFLFDPGWQIELVAFAVLGLVAAIAWWRIGRPRDEPSDERPMLNRRAERQIGRVFTLEAPIAGGDGRVRIDDTSWRISGPDLPSGTRVKVVAVDGATLLVLPEV